MIEIFLLFCIGLQIARYFLIEDFFRRNRGQKAVLPIEKVSVLQAILSGDPTLWDCLRRNLLAKTDYQLEWFWLLDTSDKEGIRGCQALKDEFPQANIQLIQLDAAPDGVNPKMFKLIAGEKLASGDVIVVLDDDTILPDYGLENSIAYLADEKVGLSFGLGYYINYSNFWSSMVSSIVNSNSLTTYVPYIYLIAPLTINGMFYTIQRKTLRKIGGFQGLETQLCDDFAIARRVLEHGLQLKQSPVRHAISTQINDFAHYQRLITRWFIFPQVSILKQATLPQLLVFYGMVLFPVVFPLLVTALVIALPSLWLYGLAYWLVHIAMLLAINERFIFRTASIPMLLMVQVLIPFHIIWALLSPRRINWRGHIIEILPDNQIHYVQRKS